MQLQMFYEQKKKITLINLYIQRINNAISTFLFQKKVFKNERNIKHHEFWNNSNGYQRILKRINKLSTYQLMA